MVAALHSPGSVLTLKSLGHVTIVEHSDVKAAHGRKVGSSIHSLKLVGGGAYREGRATAKAA